MNPDDVPDKTLTECIEDDEFEDWDQKDYDEMQADAEDMWLMTKYTAAAMGIGMLLADDVITFREYIEYLEHIEDKADEDDVQLP
jgi:hypothetical protein